MSRQIEIANDLRSQETHDIREDGELEAGEDFFGDSCAADAWATLEHERLLSRAREVCSGDEAIVPAPDDDRVVPAVAIGRRHARFRSGSKNGSFLTTASASLRRCSTVISIITFVPGVK